MQKITNKLNITLILTILIYFLIQFYNTHLFSESFEILTLRNIDDGAMQGAISEWHRAIFEGRLSQIFFKFDYGYGWIFWFLYGILSLPGAFFLRLYPNKIEVESLIIQSNRITTVLLAIIFIYVFRQLLKQVSLRYVSKEVPNNIIKNYINYATLICLFSPSLGYWIGRVQPNILVITSFTSSLYFLIKSKPISQDKIIDRKNLYYSIILLSLAIASKLVTIFWLPLYFLSLYFIHINFFQKKGFKHVLKKISLYSVLITFFSLSFLSPSFIISPLKTLRKAIEMFSYFSRTNTQIYTDFPEITNRLVTAYFDQMIGFFSFTIIFLLALLPVFCKKKINLASIFICSYVFLIGLILSIYGPTYKFLIASYAFPALTFLALSGLFSLQILIEMRLKTIIAFFIGFFVILNFFLHLDTSKGDRQEGINTYIIDSQSIETKQKTLEIKELKKIIKLDEDPFIVQSFLTPTAYSSMYSKISVMYVFRNWKTVENINQIDWVLLPKNEYDTDKFFESQNGEVLQLGDRQCQNVKETIVSVILECK